MNEDFLCHLWWNGVHPRNSVDLFCIAKRTANSLWLATMWIPSSLVASCGSVIQRVWFCANQSVAVIFSACEGPILVSTALPSLSNCHVTGVELYFRGLSTPLLALRSPCHKVSFAWTIGMIVLQSCDCNCPWIFKTSSMNASNPSWTSILHSRLAIFIL